MGVRNILTGAGAVVGSLFGQPQLGLAIGSLIGNIVDPQRIKAPGLKEFPVLGVTEGAYRQVAYGTTVIRDCQLIDWGPLDPVIVEEQQGKGGGPVVESQRLYQTYAVAIGEPIEAVRYIKRDGVMVYDLRPGSTILPESADFAGRLRIYLGDEAQLPDPDLEALATNGVGNTPSYRGTSYFVVVRDDLTDNGGRIPTYEVEVVQGASAVGGFNWFAGPVAYLGSPHYIRSATLAGLVSNTPTPIPAQGSGLVQRLSVANGAVFMHRSTLACVSFDRGGTWTACDNSLWGSSWPRDVYWNGSRYYYGGVSSADGLAWTAIPNLPSGGRVQLARGDGYILVQDAAGVTYSSINNGSSWTTRADLGSTYTTKIASDGTQFGFSSSGGFVYSSDDDMATAINNTPTSGSRQGVHYSNGAWYVWSNVSGAGGTGSGFERNTAPRDWLTPGYAANLSLFVDGRDFADELGSDGAGTLAAFYPNAGAFLWGSYDNGETWSSIGTLDANLRSVVAIPGAGSATISDSAVPLSAIVEDIADRCGIPAGKLDLAELTDEVKGLTLGGAYDGAGAITTLMPPYFFDLYEADKKIHAPKRGGAVKATISEADFIEDPDENSLRGQDIEYPRKLQLKYLNPAQNYAAPAAVVARTTPDVRVRGEANIDLPICMDETEALRTADRILKTMWEDLNGEISFSLPSGPFAWLSPTDCLGLSLRGALYRVRVEKVQDVDGVLQVTARRDRQSAYTSTLTAIPLPPPAGPPPSLAGITQFVVLNIPGVQDADDQIGVRIGVCGLPGTAWAGATVRYSINGGASWTSLGSFTTPARMGTLTAGLPTNLAGYTDATNPLQVVMLDDRQLEAVTQLQLLQEGNGAAIANPDGTAELIQFRDVVDEGARAWTLRTLLRGGLNTEASAHLVGAKFVMLDGTTFVPLPSGLIGSTIRFQFVSNGTSPETAPVFDMVWNPAVSQTEFPPASLALTRGSGVISATWAPRHRFGTDVNPIAGIRFKGYRATLTDGTVTQVHELLAPAYSGPDTAFTGPITVTVQQLNHVTGAGPGTSGII